MRLSRDFFLPCAEADPLRASALRALGDNPGMVDAYRDSIAAAEAAGDTRLLACAHDILGDALTDLGLFDDALRHYETAGSSKSPPGGKPSWPPASPTPTRRTWPCWPACTPRSTKIKKRFQEPILR